MNADPEIVAELLAGDNYAEDPAGSHAKGPRRPRIHNKRLLGSRAYQETPAKTKRQRRNRDQRNARKANRA